MDSAVWKEESCKLKMFIRSLHNIVIAILLLSNIPQFYNVLAESPIFGRSLNTDDSYESNVDSAKYIANNTISLDNLPVDILSSTFFSDGRTLNATIWLSDPIYDEKYSDYVRANLTFSMGIDSEAETLYNVTVYPKSDGTWTMVVYEYEPDLLYWENVPMPEHIPEISSRLLKIVENYTGFYKDGERYIDISVDLDTTIIFLPDGYWIWFYVNAISQNGTYLYDDTYRQHAPPRLNLYEVTMPESTKVRAGEEEIATMWINTTDLNVEETYSFVDANENDGIKVNFEPESVTMPLTGARNIKLIVKADEYTYKGNPTQTNQTLTLDSITAQGVQDRWNETFDIEILPPLSIEERISNILRDNVFTYVVPLAVTSVFAIWLSRRITKTKYNPDWIRVKDILTVDASVIAGVLIFLTVGASDVFSGNIQQVGILTASIVFPFAIAAIRTLIKGEIEEHGIKFMVSGFIYLMTSVVLIAFVQR